MGKLFNASRKHCTCFYAMSYAKSLRFDYEFLSLQTKILRPPHPPVSLHCKNKKFPTCFDSIPPSHISWYSSCLSRKCINSFPCNSQLNLLSTSHQNQVSETCKKVRYGFQTTPFETNFLFSEALNLLNGPYRTMYKVQGLK